MTFTENGIIIEQEKICLKYKADFLQAPFDSIIGVALETFERKLKPINGLRHWSSGGTDSGWYVWAGGYSTGNDFFKPIHVKHLFEICPETIEFLGLAPGWRFLIGDDNYEDIWFDETILKI